MSAVVFTAYLIILGTGYWLKYLNLSYLKAHGKTVPPEVQGVVDPAQLEKISAYTFENSRVGYFESILGNILTILFLFAGLLGVYDRWILSLTGSLLWGGLLFSLIMLYAETIIDIPFSLYRNFKIENRYGFNTMTMRLWFIDLIKSIDDLNGPWFCGRSLGARDHPGQPCLVVALGMDVSLGLRYFRHVYLAFCH